MAKRDLSNEIERLARIVERMTVPVQQQVPIPVVPPVVPTGDHDMLVAFRAETMSELKNIRTDLTSLNDGMGTKLADHETRLRSLEKESEDHALVKKVVYGAVAFILLAVLSAIVFLVVQK